MSNLQHSPARIVAQLLTNMGVGVAPPARPWTIQVDQEPPGPDNCITLYNTQGQEDGRSMLDGEIFHHYGFQVRLRTADPKSGWVKAEAVRQTFAKNIYGNTVKIDASIYTVRCVVKIGQVLSLGTETPNSKRHIYTINALVLLDSVT